MKYLWLVAGVVLWTFPGARPVQAQTAQTAVLRGQVVDAAEEGAPLPGANVVVRGEARRGTSTDAEGRYAFTLPAGAYRMTVSIIGYETQERSVRLAPGDTATVRFAMDVQAYDLAEIVVRGSRMRETAPTTVQRLSVAEIMRQDPTTAADVARLIPAAHVQTNSRGQTLVYFRGAGDRQTAQFFDRALLNVPWDNRVDLGMLPAAMLAGVTVSKGVPSVRYGANVVGGAVNFQSRVLDRPGSVTEVTTEVGTPRAMRTSVLHLGRRGAFSYTASLGVASRGDFALPAGADLSYSQPSGETRTNTDRRLANGFLRGAYQFGSGAQMAVSLLHIDAEQGIAPESHVDPAEQGVRYWRYPTWRKSMLIVSGRAPLGGEARLRGTAWGSRFAQDIYQYRGVAYERLKETQGDLDYTAGLRLIWTRPAGPGALDVVLNALTTRHRQNIISYEDGTPGPDSASVYRQHTFSVGTEYDVPLTGRLEVTLGASLDGTVLPETGPYPARDPFYAYGLTSGLTYDLSERFTVRAAAGRKTRFPTMRELFGAALGKFVPNPHLKPVSALVAEAGLEARGARLSGAVTAFVNRTDDTIDKITLRRGPNAGREQRINLAGSRVYGLELVAAARPTDRLALDGHLTWMRPRGFIEGETQKLDEKPAWLGALTLAYDLPLGLRALVQAEYLGGVYTRAADNAFVPLPDATIFDARLSYTFAPPGGWFTGGEVFARVNNLTDEVRLLQLGLPGPGRAFSLGATISL